MQDGAKRPVPLLSILACVHVINPIRSAFRRLSPMASPRKVIRPRSRAGPRSGRRQAALKEDDIREIFRRFAAHNPEPKGELEHTNTFTLLVAVVLSAQATDAGVNKATRALFKIADTPQKMVALGEEKLREYVKSIGLYRNKARNIILLSEKLLALFGGQVPADRDALETLPGVGRKTANVVMNVAFGEPTMAVDTHVFRVANRTGLSAGKTPLDVEKDLLRVVPPEYGVHAHHWLILHGRYICKARKPACPRCIINALCLYPDKTTGP
jgi:endonuclease-3